MYLLFPCPPTGPSHTTLPATGRDNVRVRREIVPEMPESNGASATPTPRPQGISGTSVRMSLTSGARSPIPDPGFSPEVLAKLPRLAHGSYLLPPYTVTSQQRSGCAAPKVLTERSLYIKKEAEFRRSRAEYCKAQRQFEQAKRDLSLFDAIMQASDHERLPSLTRQW